MGETGQIIISIVFLLLFFFLTQFLMARKYRSAAQAIVDDMKNKDACSPENAIAIDFGKKNLFKMGVRDYRPKALKAMIQAGMIKITDDGRCYLAEADPKAEDKKTTEE